MPSTVCRLVICTGYREYNYDSYLHNKAVWTTLLNQALVADLFAGVFKSKSSGFFCDAVSVSIDLQWHNTCLF